MDMETRFFAPGTMNIGLSDENRTAILGMLNTLLADEYVIYTKTRNYHWNVVGEKFNSLHEFFEKQYKELDEFVDEIAERNRSLGGTAPGSMQQFLELARCKEDLAAPPPAMQMVSNLLQDHEALICALRQDIKKIEEQCDDVSTSDFLTGIMEDHEKMAWMLRAFITPEQHGQSAQQEQPAQQKQMD